MSTRCSPCLLCGQSVDTVYLRKLQSFRPILPKIVLETVDEEPVDPMPAQLVSKAELTEIELRVQEALRAARKRHTAGDQASPLDLSRSTSLYTREKKMEAI